MFGKKDKNKERNEWKSLNSAVPLFSVFVVLLSLRLFCGVLTSQFFPRNLTSWFRSCCRDETPTCFYEKTEAQRREETINLAGRDVTALCDVTEGLFSGAFFHTTPDSRQNDAADFIASH